VYCQVCCEPFHKFCLEESERPLEDQLENWCCRRCKFCHVCGRQHQATKVPHATGRPRGQPRTAPRAPRSGARAPGSRGLCASATACWGLSSCSAAASSSCPRWGVQPETKMSRGLHPLEGSLFQCSFPLFLQQLLECNKCRNSYHPECLGPNYPTKPTKKKKVWVRDFDFFLRQFAS